MTRQAGLFDPAAPGFEEIELADARMRFMPRFYDPAEADRLFDLLLKETDWRQESVVIAGQARQQPRLCAWIGDVGYAYSGLSLAARAWSPTLARIRQQVEAASGHAYNSVLLNLYRNEADAMGWHSDSEPELGPDPAIASLSLGATRSFRLRHARRRDLRPLSLALSHGSLLLMESGVQRFWRHAVPRESAPCGPRINLTFRWIGAG
ncbi:DNA-N1-methyladenine dioxygenase [Noviherbaspirillum humi]|uniref:DNA-N1-methyladenine dioxygenase n=1 Tax=Noviherbaspirillum humi TaxID=1688639 RepID=A0A239KFG8_9BURK|nr:alpha-ketoglutarate-dependent dioxygenase AlkB [Noviherbaspirillum humi]SNT16379.1 DNA-N1-methyladenine dioxygenase [Noviherbaspirillum humi]